MKIVASMNWRCICPEERADSGQFAEILRNQFQRRQALLPAKKICTSFYDIFILFDELVNLDV